MAGARLEGESVTGDQRRAAGSIAVQLQRAARALARAIQAADAGDEGELVHLLNAELDVAGVGHRLAQLRRGVAIEAMDPGGAPAVEAGEWGPPREAGNRARPHDATTGRFQKVARNQAP